MKTCIVCEKSKLENEICDTHDFLGVCQGCEPWLMSSADLIQDHRESLLKHYSSGVRSAFMQKHDMEQKYITIRSLEKANGVK